MAAEQGLAGSKATLAMLYQEGRLVERDEEKAIGLVSDRMLRIGVVGTPADVIERLAPGFHDLAELSEVLERSCVQYEAFHHYPHRG